MAKVNFPMASFCAELIEHKTRAFVLPVAAWCCTESSCCCFPSCCHSFLLLFLYDFEFWCESTGKRTNERTSRAIYCISNWSFTLELVRTRHFNACAAWRREEKGRLTHFCNFKREERLENLRRGTQQQTRNTSDRFSNSTILSLMPRNAQNIHQH